MYVRQIAIDGLKLLTRFSLDFTRNGTPRMWTVLVGRNGLCKTSVLRAIALAASGRDLANELSGDLRLSFPDQRRSDPLLINASFEFGAVGNALNRQYPGWNREDRPQQLEVELTLGVQARSFIGTSNYRPYPPSNGSGIDPLAEARLRSLPHWFVAGYGVQRLLRSGAAKGPEDFVRGRLASLFDSGALVSTDFADHLAKQFGADEARNFAVTLRQALLNHAELLPRIKHLELRGQGGTSSSDRLINSHRFDMAVGKGAVRLPATWLSHGYQAIVAWLADLVGHVIWEARVAGRTGFIPPDEMEGLVLVDELDLHLHPEWQVGLIAALKQTFPQLQFIVTTHSPMLLTSLEPDEIVVLEEDPATGNIQWSSDPRTPKLQTSGELLERYFDVDELHPSGLLAKFQRYGFLAHNPFRSDDEEGEMRELLNDLQREGVAPSWEPLPRKH